MCLIAFSYNVHPQYPLVIIANRDEFYDRPTAAAHFWEDEPSILAGRDLRQHGSWLGVSKSGRFAAITNFRDPPLPVTGLLSRGEIVQQFLISNESAEQFIASLREKKALYGGFNVLLYDGQEMQHYNNIFDEHNNIESGTYSVSNATINTSWPKTDLAKNMLEETSKNGKLEARDLISLLANEEIAQDEVLPDTGVGIHLERALSAQFVKLPNYGTRCSTAIAYHKNGQIDFLERTYEDGKYKFDRSYLINTEE
ncbi:NRDE family protein [Solibacillus silvestris]|uniref:NRDE family protein n=1 Tax=Solibacillus silvestris TaxID=76853 RepID=UPI003F8015F3